MKKRGLTLAGGIVGTVVCSILTILFLLAVMVLLDVAAELGGGGAVVMVGVLMLLVNVAGLVLNILSICTFGKTPEKFNKWKGTVITAIVFNFIIGIYSLYTGIVGGENVGTMLIYVLFAIALVTAAILMIVDVCLEKKRAAQTVPTEQAPAIEQTEQPKTDAE